MKLWHNSDGYNTFILDVDNELSIGTYVEMIDRKKVDEVLQVQKASGVKTARLLIYRTKVGTEEILNPSKWTLMEDFVMTSLRAFIMARGLTIKRDWIKSRLPDMP